MALPPGTTQRPTPRTPAQGKRLYSNDRIKTLTKVKIQEYIEGFFDRLGDNHDLLRVVSPRSLSYNIERSFEAQMDPTQRKMQIARYFNELRSIIPAILILDSGVEPMNQNIGQIGEAAYHDGYWYGYYPIMRQVPITVLVAARDMETADDLSGLVSLMFNELRNLAGGSYMTGNVEEGERWMVSLPNAGVPVGALVQIPVENDPLEKIFYAEMSFNVFFEDTVAVKQLLPTFKPKGEFVGVEGNTVGNPDVRKLTAPIISCPEAVPLNQQTIVFISNFQQQHRVQISNPNIATISPTMMLTPHRFGTFKIQVYDPAVEDPLKRVVAEKTIKVV